MSVHNAHRSLCFTKTKATAEKSPEKHLASESNGFGRIFFQERSNSEFFQGIAKRIFPRDANSGKISFY